MLSNTVRYTREFKAIEAKKGQKGDFADKNAIIIHLNGTNRLPFDYQEELLQIWRHKLLTKLSEVLA